MKEKRQEEREFRFHCNFCKLGVKLFGRRLTVTASLAQGQLGASTVEPRATFSVWQRGSVCGVWYTWREGSWAGEQASS